jgi:hypothetical protein
MVSPKKRMLFQPVGRFLLLDSDVSHKGFYGPVP